MKHVKPIKNRQKIEGMKAILREEERYRDLLWITIGLNTALRISDILNLKVEDVRSEDGRFREVIFNTDQKTDKFNQSPINKSMKEALELFFQKNDKSQKDYLFTAYNNSGNHLTRQRCSQILKELANKIGIEKNINTHSLRKSFGFWALKSGNDSLNEGQRLGVIQKKLNHKSPRQTLDYVGLSFDEVNEVVQNLNL